MFQFPPCPPTGLCVQPAVTEYCSAGFPHSGASGSTFDDNSPKLIAAIRALLRLLAPRHPPHALSSLIHVRRQHLILSRLLRRRSRPRMPGIPRPPRRHSRRSCYTSYFYSAQLLRCPGATHRSLRSRRSCELWPARPLDRWRLPPNPRSEPPASHPDPPITQNCPAQRQAALTVPNVRLCPGYGVPVPVICPVKCHPVWA